MKKKREVINATLTAISSEQISEHFIRIQFNTDKPLTINPSWIGPHIKLLFPLNGALQFPDTNEEGKIMWQPGQRERIRTYSIREYDQNHSILTIDFAIHEKGVATLWAQNVKNGEQIGIVAMGSKNHYEDNDNWLFFGDIAAIPAMSYGLERLPEGKRAIAFLTVPHESDKLAIKLPDNAKVEWIISEDSTALLTYFEQYTLPEDFISPRIFGGMETSLAQGMRRLLKERYPELPPDSKFITSYWRKGFAEGEFKHSD